MRRSGSGPGRRGAGALREALAAAGLAPRKSLGQNFLVDERALDAIAAAADLSPHDVVLEIGPGPGVLTERLAGAERHVLACEIDPGLLEFARERLAGGARGIEWLEGDAIDGRGRFAPRLESALRAAISLEPGRRSWKLVANLPYGISVPAVILALAFDPPPERAVVTVQREVGDRLRASPGTKAFGAVSVLVALLADSDVVLRLSPGAFWPAPQVRSIVLRFRPRHDEDRNLAATNDFQRFVRDCFSERRKQLAPLLEVRSEGRVRAETVAAALEAQGKPARARADALPAGVFATLYRNVWAAERCAGPDAPSI